MSQFCIYTEYILKLIEDFTISSLGEIIVMAELPFHLKTIEPLPGALDILRYLGTLDSFTADADDICDSLDLSDRRFSKAIRRLVTKEYVVMDGDMVYRLTEQGQGAVEEIADFDAEMGKRQLLLHLQVHLLPLYLVV